MQTNKTALHGLMPVLLLFTAIFFLAGEAWADIAATRNVYLDAVVEWHPEAAGSARRNFWGWTDEHLMPIQNDYALGAPTGTGSWTSGGPSTVVGINGWATWRFEEGFYIYNGEGDDFRTFQDNFAWGGTADGLCNELGHVQVSADLEHWYYNSAEMYIENPNPGQSNDDYSYIAVSGLHGANPTWANYKQDMKAQELQEVNGVLKWVNVEGEIVSKDFSPTDPYLGGDGFDLSTFLSVDDDTPWQDDMQMRYLRIIDDDTILDGQDWSKPWCLGTHLNAAMGINVMQETPVPVPGTLVLLCSGLLGLTGFGRKSKVA